MSAQNLLQNVYLFKSMDGSEMEKISALAQGQPFAVGDTVFSQGSSAEAMYFIKYGSVRITQQSSAGDAIEVTRLGTGSHFGEMALVDGEKRSATVEATEKAEIVILPFGPLLKLLEANPTMAVKFYRELAHFLCGRLRLTTNDLSFSREKNLRHF